MGTTGKARTDRYSRQQILAVPAAPYWTFYGLYRYILWFSINCGIDRALEKKASWALSISSSGLQNKEDFSLYESSLMV